MNPPRKSGEFDPELVVNSCSPIWGDLGAGKDLSGTQGCDWEHGARSWIRERDGPAASVWKF